MRFISLSEERVNILTRIYKYSKYHRVRQRAHCILLSNEGRAISDLQKISEFSEKDKRTEREKY